MVYEGMREGRPPKGVLQRAARNAGLLLTGKGPATSGPSP